ncbi:MAG: LytTR family DNA-binding domain-containing protein [Oscillospiraceae bacterium]|jgi:DNA-binding LytR/AlgR family response regulator|nr:LytTR family DNA-binding domain-containing protein [Oscillospiraceae bacterium]
MQLAVCDDNKYHLLEMKEKLSQLTMVENAYFFSELPLFLDSIEDGRSYDAVLMDIEWGHGKTGMDAAEELYKLSPETKIIYVTGHSDKYSQHIFLRDANLSGFIAKPVDIEILASNLNKIASAIPLGDEPSLVVRRGGALISIPFREIYFIESYKHTVTIHSVREAVVSYERLDRITQSLPAGFYQCHKSYIVNMRQIQRFQSDEILLKNGKSVPVSRSKYNETKDAYLRFIGQTF